MTMAAEQQFEIRIEDFSRFPGGRYRSKGRFSGEAFRDDILNDALENHEVILVNLTEARVLLPSFIDEAFGPFIANVGEAKFRERVKFVFREDTDMEANVEETIRKRTGKGKPAK